MCFMLFSANIVFLAWKICFLVNDFALCIVKIFLFAWERAHVWAFVPFCTTQLLIFCTQKFCGKSQLLYIGCCVTPPWHLKEPHVERVGKAAWGLVWEHVNYLSAGVSTKVSKSRYWFWLTCNTFRDFKNVEKLLFVVVAILYDVKFLHSMRGLQNLYSAGSPHLP
jgi:hypothetical protein